MRALAPDALDLAIKAIMPDYFTDKGHGHIWPRPDGTKARCGGPALCVQCARDAGMLKDARDILVIKYLAKGSGQGGGE